MMTKIVRYFTKQQLVKANAIAIKRGYNRALKDSFVDGLSDGFKYPVIHHMIHRHKNGIECDQHVRVFFATDSDSRSVIDCDWNLFYKLSAVTLP